jgi:hypothetical protein
MLFQASVLPWAEVIHECVMMLCFLLFLLWLFRSRNERMNISGRKLGFISDTHTHTHTHTYIHTHSTHAHTHTRTHAHTYIHTQHARTHTHTYTHTYTHTHTHTHTHTQCKSCKITTSMGRAWCQW